MQLGYVIASNDKALACNVHKCLITNLSERVGLKGTVGCLDKIHVPLYVSQNLKDVSDVVCYLNVMNNFCRTDIE